MVSPEQGRLSTKYNISSYAFYYGQVDSHRVMFLGQCIILWHPCHFNFNLVKAYPVRFVLMEIAEILIKKRSAELQKF